jgi:hypothetical protein
MSFFRRQWQQPDLFGAGPIAEQTRDTRSSEFKSINNNRDAGLGRHTHVSELSITCGSDSALKVIVMR